tara:strand:+ start:157 stop:672 length:516 start_codon:yes stop_codon:yes gene_type:complete
MIINTSSYKDKNYIKAKYFYEKHIVKFHKRYIKLLTDRKKDKDFSIKIIDFDGSINKIYYEINYSIIKDIFQRFNLKDQQKLLKEVSKIKPQDLSLFSDYSKETTTPNLGFKDKEKAIYTINKIKNRSLKYQVSVISTMIGRAKSHPNQTKEMRDAIKIFQKWLDEYHKNK